MRQRAKRATRAHGPALLVNEQTLGCARAPALLLQQPQMPQLMPSLHLFTSSSSLLLLLLPFFSSSSSSFLRLSKSHIAPRSRNVAQHGRTIGHGGKPGSSSTHARGSRPLQREYFQLQPPRMTRPCQGPCSSDQVPISQNTGPWSAHGAAAHAAAGIGG